MKETIRNTPAEAIESTTQQTNKKKNLKQLPEKRAGLRYRSDKVLQVITLILDMNCMIENIKENSIFVDADMWNAVVDEDCYGEITLSFHVNTDTGYSAGISREFSRQASMLRMPVSIERSYAFEVDEDNVVTNLVRAKEAYNLVGRVPFSFLGGLEAFLNLP